jgi:hypothetical protein
MEGELFQLDDADVGGFKENYFSLVIFIYFIRLYIMFYNFFFYLV